MGETEIGRVRGEGRESRSRRFPRTWIHHSSYTLSAPISRQPLNVSTSNKVHYGEYVPGYVSSYTQWKIGWMYFAIVVKKNGSLLEWSCFRTINRGIVSLSLSFFFNKSNFLIYLKKKKERSMVFWKYQNPFIVPLLFFLLRFFFFYLTRNFTNQRYIIERAPIFRLERIGRAINNNRRKNVTINGGGGEKTSPCSHWAFFLLW